MTGFLTGVADNNPPYTLIKAQYSVYAANSTLHTPTHKGQF